MDPADLLRSLEEPTNRTTGVIKAENDIKQEPHEDDEEMMSTVGRQAVYARVFNVGFLEAMRMESQADLIQTNLIKTENKQILKWRRTWAKYRKGTPEKKKKEKKEKTRTQPKRTVLNRATIKKTANDKIKNGGQKSASPKVPTKPRKPLAPKNFNIKKVANREEKKRNIPKQEPNTAGPAKKRGRPAKATSPEELPKKKLTSIESNNTVENRVVVVSDEKKTKKEAPKMMPKSVDPAKKRGRPAKTICTTEPPKKQQKGTKSTTATERKNYVCPICSEAAKNGTCLCNQCGEWVHLKCAKIRASQYNNNFRCQNCSV